MAPDLSTNEREQILALWQNWQASRAAHQALYFDFHEEVVRQHPDLAHVTLFQTLGTLVPMDTQHPPEDT